MFNNLGDVDFNFLPHNIQCNIKVNRIFWLWINNSLLKLLNMILFSFNSSRFQYMIKILNYEIYLTFRCWHHQWHQCLKQCRSMRIVILLVISVDWLRMTWQICLILKAEERLFQMFLFLTFPLYIVFSFSHNPSQFVVRNISMFNFFWKLNYKYFEMA